MSKKAIITNVTITETTYTATYESGVTKSGNLDKMPKTVQAWIDKNQATDTKTETKNPEVDSMCKNCVKFGTDCLGSYTNNLYTGCVYREKKQTPTEQEKKPEPVQATQLPAVTRQPVQMPLKDYGGFFCDLTTVTILPIIGAILTGTAETIRLLSWICFQLAKLAGWIQPKARKAVDMLKSYTAKTAEKIKEVAPVIVSQMRQTAESLKAWTAAAMKYRSETMKTDFTLIVKEVTQ